MPKLRGISLAIVAHWDHRTHPEFPHPESKQTSSKHTFSSASKKGTDNVNPRSTSGGSTDTLNLEDRSRVSVYIPSVPGARFFLKYSIAPPHPDGQLFYFKLFMNGRHINSWGIDPRKMPRGQVMRAFFEAIEIWDYDRSNVGGIDARILCFASTIKGQKPAEEGGIIEVQTFRTSGKRRKVPMPEPFNAQSKYGIDFPNDGPIESPQDTRFYDWALVDPKDTPHVTFRFHYRTWDHLQYFHLIPPEQPRRLLTASHSIGTLSEFLARQQRADAKLIRESQPQEEPDEDEMEFSHLSLEEKGVAAKIRNKLPGILKKTRGILRNPRVRVFSPTRLQSKVSQELPEPPELATQEFNQPDYHMPVSKFSAKSTVVNQWMQEERPLPEPPVDRRSIIGEQSRNSSKSSLDSEFSVTPSLQSWVNAGIDSRNPSPDHVFGIARTVPVEEMYGPITILPNVKTEYDEVSGSSDGDEDEEKPPDNSWPDEEDSIHPYFAITPPSKKHVQRTSVPYDLFSHCTQTARSTNTLSPREDTPPSPARCIPYPSILPRHREDNTSSPKVDRPRPLPQPQSSIVPPPEGIFPPPVRSFPRSRSRKDALGEIQSFVELEEKHLATNATDDLGNEVEGDDDPFLQPVLRTLQWPARVLPPQPMQRELSIVEQPWRLFDINEEAKFPENNQPDEIPEKNLGRQQYGIATAQDDDSTWYDDTVHTQEDTYLKVEEEVVEDDEQYQRHGEFPASPKSCNTFGRDEDDENTVSPRPRSTYF